MRARRFGLWLGLLALAIQGVFPFLLAAELRAATVTEDVAAFCRVDANGSPSADGGMEPGQSHEHVHCPSCLGLQSGGSFLPADAPKLPLPSLSGKAVVLGGDTATISASFTLAYRSRAPPFQG